jgi:hypothetical protein
VPTLSPKLLVKPSPPANLDAVEGPDAIIEIHRQYIQDRTDIAYGTTRRVAPILNDLLYVGSCALDVSVDRVWFVKDARGRVWKERTDGRWHDPQRHYAIDLAISNAAVRIKSIACTRMAPSDPEVITVPTGPQAGKQQRMQWNEIPLLGRLTIHTEVIPLEVAGTGQTVALDFTEDASPAPTLYTKSASEKFGPLIFGRGVKRDSQFTEVSGPSPRLTWELDYDEVYLITHSPAAVRAIDALKRFSRFGAGPTRLRLLDLIATKMAENAKPFVSQLGRNGVLQVLPRGIEIDSSATDPRSFVAIDARVQRIPGGNEAQESLVVQLRAPGGDQEVTMQRSFLGDDPDARAALAITASTVPRLVREACTKAFGLADGDFVADQPCQLSGAKAVRFDGRACQLDSLSAAVSNSTGGGQLVIAAGLSVDHKLYSFEAEISASYDLVVGDVPHDVMSGGRAGNTFENARRTLRSAARQQRDSPLGENYEIELDRVCEALDALPKTTGVLPRTADRSAMRHRFDLTPAGLRAAEGDANLIASLVSSRWTIRSGDDERREPGELLGLAFADYVSKLIQTEWFCSGLWGASTSDAQAAHASSLLPSIGTPTGSSLNQQRLVVWYR